MSVLLQRRLGRDTRQVLAVAALSELRTEGEELLPVYPPGVEGDLLGAGDPQALAPFERRDELGRLDEAVGSARIQPGVAASHGLDVQLTAFEIRPVNVSDLEFPARRGLEPRRDV